MEKLKSLPLYRRFGFRVLLFNLLLLTAVIIPSVIIWRSDYKHLLDRSHIHSALFNYWFDGLSGKSRGDWVEDIEGFPRILNRQRMLLFGPKNELIYDSGTAEPFTVPDTFELILPDPYIDPDETGAGTDPEVLVRYLRAIDISARTEDVWSYHGIRSLHYEEGIDRVLLSARKTDPYGEGSPVFVLVSSVTDILIQGRGLKERFLIICGIVGSLALILTLVLSWSVTRPLKKLYRYSLGILESRRRRADFIRLPKTGEIGGICRALQNLINEQRRQAENFGRFSSDVVHELKTPLAAIRSGLELYSESGDETEKQEIYTRINTRIQRMEELMNEIEQLGNLESRADSDDSVSPVGAVEEAVSEFEDARIITEIRPEVHGIRIPLSSEMAYRITVNLLRNAVSFSPERGSVTLSVFRNSRYLYLRVRDRGPGIPDGSLREITRRFYSHRPRQDEKHSGLGLAIVETILASAGGKLMYSNNPEGGAEFICRIPILPVNPASGS